MQNSTNAVQPPSSQILYQGMETKFIGSPQKTYHYWVFHLCHFPKSDSTKTIKNSDMENRWLFYLHYQFSSEIDSCFSECQSFNKDSSKI